MTAGRSGGSGAWATRVDRAGAFFTATREGTRRVEDARDDEPPPRRLPGVD